MKKIITLIAAAAMLAVSCQNTELEPVDNGNSSAPGKLTATIVQTKVSYAETSEMNLQPAWEVGDKIIGFDDAGNTYTLTVASVSAATATLSGTVPDGVLHLIYKSGAQASDISSKTLAIDYTAQKGDKTMPAVMLADGTVAGGSCNFTFSNAGAIIGISAVNGIPSGTTIGKITIEGENLSAATVTLSGSTLALTAATAPTDAISTAALSGITTTDANGTLSRPVFIAVPAGAKIAKVSVPVTKEPETMKIPSTAADKEGIDYVTIAGKKWAKWNVGASSQADYGWDFPWAGTEGYIRYADTWQSEKTTSFEFSYSLSSSKTTSASDYLYVKNQTFETAGHSFSWENALYHIDASSTAGWTKYIPTGKSSYWSGEGSPDNKTVLDMVDDAARANWGTPWRMPTYAEFEAMKAATYWAWDSTDKGYYVYAPSLAEDAGKVNSGTGTYSKSSALLFLPAAGAGNGTDYSGAGSNGCYWSSSLRLDIPRNANYIPFDNSSVNLPGSGYRNRGYSVRPVSD